MSQDTQNITTDATPERITLDKVLQAYRVIAAPARMSHWYQDISDLVAEMHDHIEGDNVMDLLKAGVLARNLWATMMTKAGSVKLTIADSITVKPGVQNHICTIKDLVEIITDPVNAGIDKLKRKVLYSTNDGTRAAGNDAFTKWNGFQVIDMDIKNPEIAKKLKVHIFNKLCKCNWFLGVTLSASGKGLHIYTKIHVPDEEEMTKRRLTYLANFRHKYSFVYIACLDAMDSIGFTKYQLSEWLDLAMFKPAQGAFIGYDPDVMINGNFIDDYIYFSFDNVEDLGHPEIDWVTHPDLKETFARWDWICESNDDSVRTIMVNDVAEAGPDGKPHDKVHYKHNERWRIANTLVNIFAERHPDGSIKNVARPIKYMRSVVSNKVPDKEIIADCQTAARHSKPIDAWAVRRLNDMHGFNIKIKTDDPVISDSDILASMKAVGMNPNQIRPSKDYHKFNITKDQYLSDILKELIANFGRTTLIEAGPGLGKTEMVKQLVSMGKKVMMILPFTSIIKSKVETQEGWYYAYGSRKPRLDVTGGLALTIDKFSRLTAMDIQAAGFDYIFLDESHLLFMSEYRPVMPKVIDMIRNSPVPIILMSGTPTGELVFFPDMVHLHVVKEETRKKEVEIVLVDSTTTLFYHMCRDMAKDIANGKRILFPSNEGTLYSKRVQAGISYFLRTNHGIMDDLNLQYYKKSNVGDEFMDQVNFNKTIADTQVVMCTTYMGCGVDVEDKYDFQIYFGDLCTAAECDQWCNRLRNNNLLVKMYVAKNDADGNSRHVDKFRGINFKLDDDELRDVHSILRICNDMVERNPLEYKYNSVVQSIISDNRYIVYDDVACKYYIDEIAYKTVTFERKYRAYAQQLPVFMAGMECYGYTVSAIDKGVFCPTGPEIFRDVKGLVKSASDTQSQLNTAHIEELLDKFNDTNLAIYREVMAGLYEIRKGDDWTENENTKVMTVKNIEVFEKVVPIFLSMSKRFEIPVIKDIFEFCKTSGKYNFAMIGRIRTLINLIESDEARNLDLPIKKYMTDCWNFADKAKSTKDELKRFIGQHVNEYAELASGGGVDIPKSNLTNERLNKVLERLFKCLVQCTRPNKQGEFEMQRMELLWQKRGFIKPDNMNIVMLDDFLEACAHIKTQEIQVKRTYKQLDGSEIEKVETTYEIVANDDGTGAQRPFQAAVKQESPIKPRMYNDDGSRCIDSMDEAELIEFSEIN